MRYSSGIPCADEFGQLLSCRGQFGAKAGERLPGFLQLLSHGLQLGLEPGGVRIDR